MFKAFPAVIGCIGLMASFSTLAEAKLDSQKNKASYTIGVQMGMQLSQQKDDLDMNSVIQGFTDAFSGKKPQLSMEEMQQAMQTFQQQVRDKQMAEMKALGDKNAKEGKAFLDKNSINRKASR